MIKVDLYQREVRDWKLTVLVDKLKEVLSAVLPVTVIVLLLNFTLVPLETPVLLRFILGAISVILGLTLFLIGVDIGITPIGEVMGNSIAKTNKIAIITIAGLVLGFAISIAEPDLHILADQVMQITSGVVSKFSIVMVVSIGVATLVAVGLLRIVQNIKIRNIFIGIYIIILVVGIFSTPEFHAIAFDASGATTGAMTVPFILALAVGVASLKKDSKLAEEDSFGLLGLASSGAILAVLIMSVVKNPGELSGDLDQVASVTTAIWGPFFSSMKTVCFEILIALSPIVIIFLIFQITHFKMSRKSLAKILKGVVYTFLGLVLFLTGVNAGFMDVGKIIGFNIASRNNTILSVGIGFVFGLVTILAEPAVHVLTKQIEEVTSGYVKRRLVLFALSIGVGISVALSVVRILVPGIQLWHYLLPGYFIALAISFFVPNLFIGIAFDSGGVASGPMTATFILAFAMGVAEATPHANVLTDGFGVIAMVAMTPLIALQILGLIFKVKFRKKGLDSNG